MRLEQARASGPRHRDTTPPVSPPSPPVRRAVAGDRRMGALARPTRLALRRRRPPAAWLGRPEERRLVDPGREDSERDAGSVIALVENVAGQMVGVRHHGPDRPIWVPDILAGQTAHAPDPDRAPSAPMTRTNGPSSPRAVASRHPSRDGVTPSTCTPVVVGFGRSGPRRKEIEQRASVDTPAVDPGTRSSYPKSSTRRPAFVRASIRRTGVERDSSAPARPSSSSTR